MPMQFPKLPRSLLYPRPVLFDNFAGGLNMVDDPTQLGLNQTPGPTFNITFTSEGRMRKRTGWTRLLGSLTNAEMVVFWPSQNYYLYQAGTTLYKYTAGSSTSVKVFSTTAVCSAVEFNGKLVVVHPVDGVFDYDGATFTSRNTTVKGTCIAAWQNKLWVGGDTSNPSRVWFSNAGSSATWTTATDYVDLRDLDDRIITAIGGGNGMDIQGRPSLLVYKANSTYRINNSTSGAYTTLHAAAGCADRGGVATTQGFTAAIDARGVWMTDGVSTPTLISRNIDPLFRLSNIATQGTPSVAATVTPDNHFLFSWPIYNPSAGTTDNHYSLEYDPVRQWWTMHTWGFVSGCVGKAPSSNDVWAVTVNRARTDIAYYDGQWASSSASFLDLLAYYKAQWASPWFEPIPGRNTMLQHLRIRGNSTGGLTVGVLKNGVASETTYVQAAAPVDATHEFKPMVAYGLGVANTWQLHITDSSQDYNLTSWNGVDNTWPLYGANEPPFQIDQLAATFYMQGLATT